MPRSADIATNRGRHAGRTAGRALFALVVPPTSAALLSLAGGRSEALDALTTFAPLIAIWLPLAGAVVHLLARPRSLLRRLNPAIAAAGLAACAALIVPEYSRPIPHAVPGAGQPVLRVLTFNVWRWNHRPAETVAAIAAAGADIVLLQESEGAVGRNLAALSRLYPYRTPCPGPCGETILSRRPFTAPTRLLDEHGPLHIARTTAPDGGPVALVTTHYTWPLPGWGQPAQRRRLLAALAGIDKSDLIVSADMNLTPWSFAMARQDAAFAPLVRQTRAIFSWPARIDGGWRVPLPPFLPIDQLYAGPDWALVEAHRLAATGSDHYPVLVTLVRRVRR